MAVLILKSIALLFAIDLLLVVLVILGHKARWAAIALLQWLRAK